MNFIVTIDLPIRVEIVAADRENAKRAAIEIVITASRAIDRDFTGFHCDSPEFVTMEVE